MIGKKRKNFSAGIGFLSCPSGEAVNYSKDNNELAEGDYSICSAL